MKLKLLVLDVDGTMTDGGIYYDDHGNEIKKFAIKDGAGLQLAHAAGLQIMICTGRECPAVSKRANELKLDYLFQNVMDKKGFLSKFMNEHRLCAQNIAYCGDDLNDLAAMSLCGFVACPADACDEVKAKANYICPQRGGEGAVRGAIEKILKNENCWTQAVEYAFGVKP